MFQELIIWGLIIAIGLSSWQGFQSPTYFYKYLFNIGDILRRKEYYRLFSSGFLHADGFHLFFNLFSFWIFAPAVASATDSPIFIAIVLLGGIIVGNLFSLLIHYNEPGYTAVGASGGVSAIVFAAIAMYPDMELRFIFFPFFGFPAWIFGLAYILYSIFGLKTRMDNIGHAAHLGGALFGIILSFYGNQFRILYNGVYVLLMCIPLIYLLFYLVNHRK